MSDVIDSLSYCSYLQTLDLSHNKFTARGLVCLLVGLSEEKVQLFKLWVRTNTPCNDNFWATDCEELCNTLETLARPGLGKLEEVVLPGGDTEREMLGSVWTQAGRHRSVTVEDERGNIKLCVNS